MLNSNSPAPDSNASFYQDFERRPYIVAQMKMPKNKVDNHYGIRIHHKTLVETCHKLNDYLALLRKFDKCPNIYLRHPDASKKQSIAFQAWGVWKEGVSKEFCPYTPDAVKNNKWWLYFTITASEPVLNFYVFLDFVQINHYAHVEKKQDENHPWYSVLKVAQKVHKYNPWFQPLQLKGTMQMQKPNGADNKFYHTIIEVTFTGISPEHLVLEPIS